jgi:hypothetical protein
MSYDFSLVLANREKQGTAGRQQGSWQQGDPPSIHLRHVNGSDGSGAVFDQRFAGKQTRCVTVGSDAKMDDIENG